jgi:hypothetical protein
MTNIFKSSLTLTLLINLIFLIIAYSILEFLPSSGFLIDGCLLISAFIVGYLYSLNFKEFIPNKLRSNTAYLTIIIGFLIAISLRKAIDTSPVHYGQTIRPSQVTQETATAQAQEENLAPKPPFEHTSDQATTQVQEDLAHVTHTIHVMIATLSVLALLWLLFWFSVWIIYQCLGLGSRLYFYLSGKNIQPPSHE